MQTDSEEQGLKRRITWLKQKGYKRHNIKQLMKLNEEEYQRLIARPKLASLTKEQEPKPDLYSAIRETKAYEKRKEYVANRKARLAAQPFAVLKVKIDLFQRKEASAIGSFTVQDVIAKWGPNPVCYLTGLPIDYNDKQTYQLDHFVPSAKGGTSTLENLRLCHPMANQMKSGYDLEAFLNFCRLIVNKVNAETAKSPLGCDTKAGL